MGEYAVRKSDGQEVKIGTCENMYYLRYEDRDKVSPLSGNVDPAKDPIGLRFRLPFRDEDDVRPGEYKDYNRGLRLYKMVPDHMGRKYPEDFKGEGDEEPGIMQLRHEASGLLLNVPCHHGAKLPEVVAPMQAFWNGKGHSFELAHIKATAEGLFPVVRCRHCGGMWRYQWSDVLDYIEPEMRARLELLAWQANPKTEVVAYE